MQTLDLADFRRLRDEREQAELLERNAAIKEKLLPLLLADIRGDLSETDGLTLVEICDDIDVDDDEYRALRAAAVTLAKDLGQLNARIPLLESEKTRYARFAVARRRAERILEQANASMKQATSLQMQVSEFRKAIEQHGLSHPYLFTDGEPMAELVGLFPAIEKATPKLCKKCLICECDHTGDRGDFCSEKCEHIAAQHGDALIQLGIVPKTKAKK